MGNSFGCSASGERLVSAARDGDYVEAKMLLDCNPCLAKYSTFGGLNSPLHFAAAKGHNEIVGLLLEKGADVNSRNYCGQTALMQACRYGHWEVVQTLLLFRCNVTRADYLAGRTALHFAAVNGHARCIRLVLADFVPSEQLNPLPESGVVVTPRKKSEQSALSKFVNKAADGGITALHMAALNGLFDCVQLLLDLEANVSAVTFHYGTSMDMIGAGSTPLHYAACGGNLKCCQILLARGARKMTLNCNGWLPIDIARMWSRHWLEPLLSPNSDVIIPLFPRSSYLSLPLLSILNIAREFGLQSTSISDEVDICAVCLERTCTVAAEGCDHQLCVRCALYLCSSSNVPSVTVDPPGSIPCPLCRHGIVSFKRLPSSLTKELKLPMSLGFCAPCMLHTGDARDQSSPTTEQQQRSSKSRAASVSSDMFCPVTCSPFPSVNIPMCTCSDGTCPDFETHGAERDSEEHDESSPPPRVATEQEKVDEGQRLGKTTTCSSMFWGRRSCSRGATLSNNNISGLPSGGEKLSSKSNGGSRRELLLPRDGLSQISAHTFSFHEVAAATMNFHPDTFLGEGGFGRVYKGRLDSTGQVVAVKQLDRNGLQGNREFLVEVLMLSLLHHPNLVNLIGYCADGDQRLLVYEFMPLGSLEDHLHDLPPDKEALDWNMRMKIAAGAAKGLEFLHDKANPPVIYRDFKSSNILLDEGFHPKLSDFGLAKLGPTGDKSHVSTRVMGTYGYCAPEYAMTGQLTVKSDVYSFGVVFLELITGRKAIDTDMPHGEQNLVAWARPLFNDRRKFIKLADPRLKGRFPTRALYQALAVASMCIQEQAATRPLIADVVTALSYLANQAYDPNKDDSRRNRDEKGGRLITRNDEGGGSGSKFDLEGSEKEDSPRETTRILNRDINRERAVAEAKMWGESLREKRRQSEQGTSESNSTG